MKKSEINSLANKITHKNLLTKSFKRNNQFVKQFAN